MTIPAICKALDEESYEYLNTNYPALLSAIQTDLQSGLYPEDVRRIVSRQVGPDRDALAARCEQAARHLRRITE